MNITTDIAELLLRQFINRSTFLAPLETIAEPCWLIMLNLYSSHENDGHTVATLAALMNMSEPSLTRYITALEEASLVVRKVEPVATEHNRYWLTPESFQNVDDSLGNIIQGVLSALGK